MQPKQKMVRVRAKLRGYFDVRGDRHPLEFMPGDLFEVPEHMVSKRWMERVEESPAPSAPAATGPRPKQPVDSSQSPL